jgi:hypothetical protein
VLPSNVPAPRRRGNALEQVRRPASPRCPQGAPTCSCLRPAPVSASPYPGTADGAVGLARWLLPCRPSHGGFQLHRGRHHRSVTAPPCGCAVLPVCGRRSQALRVQVGHARAWWSWRGLAHPLGVRHPQTPASRNGVLVDWSFTAGLCAAAGGPRWRPLPQDGLLGHSMGGFSSLAEPWQPHAAAACRDIFFAPGKRNVMPVGQRQGAPPAAHTPPWHAMGPPLAIACSTGIGRSAGRSKKNNCRSNRPLRARARRAKSVPSWRASRPGTGAVAKRPACVPLQHTARRKKPFVKDLCLFFSTPEAL